MKYKLLEIFKNELYDEAKRLVPICYDDNDLLNCSFELLHDNLNNRYKDFEVDFHLMLPGLCIMKKEGKDYLNDQIDFKQTIDHHLKVINGKKDMNGEDLYEATHIIAEDIINNIKKYNDESLYSLIPILAKKYVKFHNDSVDWECIIMILEFELYKRGYKLSSTDLKSLKPLNSKLIKLNS